VVTEGRRRAADRAELRSALLDARLAELRDGVWVRPANLEIARPLVADEPLVWGRTELEADPTTLVADLWDLESWSTRARDLEEGVRELAPSLDAGERAALAPGFVLSAAILRHLGADPLLPGSLLPVDWPGGELREAYDRFDAAYRSVLRTWFDQHRDPGDQTH
jgi:phenylacetic acid degradation operon negative regulatory protein